jgi:hypothetical protein
MMATQIFEAARAEIGDLDDLIEKGRFTELRDWLNRYHFVAFMCVSMSMSMCVGVRYMCMQRGLRSEIWMI